MKVRPSVRKMCDKCRLIRRNGTIRIICKNPSINNAKDKFVFITNQNKLIYGKKS